ncbi:MAG: bifunctional phosphoglucose/phosphomannose isomerase [candidate division WOR-3 bacterium]
MNSSGYNKMLNLIFSLPEQFELGLNIGFECGLIKPKVIENVVIAGMGGSAIGGDIVRTLSLQTGSLPVIVWRDYRLPQAVSPRTLFFAVSYSGNTEETLAAYREAKRCKSQVIAISSGGRLAQMAKHDGLPLLSVPTGMPPRAAIGLLTIPILVVLSRFGLYPDCKKGIRDTARLLGRRLHNWHKRAQRISRLLDGNLPIVYSTSRLLDVAAYRWQCQLNENAKVMCHIGQLPEQNHNEIMALSSPRFLAQKGVLIGLFDRTTHPRTIFRFRATLNLCKDAFSRFIFVNSEGRSALARLFSVMIIGDLVSVALAKRRGVDPMAIPKIDELKSMLASYRGKR